MPSDVDTPSISQMSKIRDLVVQLGRNLYGRFWAGLSGNDNDRKFVQKNTGTKLQEWSVYIVIDKNERFQSVYVDQFSMENRSIYHQCGTISRKTPLHLLILCTWMYAARHKDELENRRGKTKILRDKRCLSHFSTSFIMALWCAGPCTIVCRTTFWTYTQNRGSNSWSCHALHRRSSVHERRTGNSPKIMWRMFSYRIQIIFFTSHWPVGLLWTVNYWVGQWRNGQEHVTKKWLIAYIRHTEHNRQNCDVTKQSQWLQVRIISRCRFCWRWQTQNPRQEGTMHIRRSNVFCKFRGHARNKHTCRKAVPRQKSFHQMPVFGWKVFSDWMYRIQSLMSSKTISHGDFMRNERKSTGSLKTSITYHPTHTFPASDHRFFVFTGQWSRDQDDHSRQEFQHCARIQDPHSWSRQVIHQLAFELGPDYLAVFLSVSPKVSPTVSASLLRSRTSPESSQNHPGNFLEPSQNLTRTAPEPLHNLTSTAPEPHQNIVPEPPQNCPPVRVAVWVRLLLLMVRAWAWVPRVWSNPYWPSHPNQRCAHQPVNRWCAKQRFFLPGKVTAIGGLAWIVDAGVAQVPLIVCVMCWQLIILEITKQWRGYVRRQRWFSISRGQK